MAGVQYLNVDEDRNGQRIDNFLMGQFSKLPKTLIYRWLRKGELRVNKKRVKQTYRVSAGDIVRIPPFTLEEDAIIRVSDDHLSFLESLILFENDDYMIINKPCGIAVHGGSGVTSGLIERLRQLRPHAKKLELAHRLDKETSGCMIIAKKYSILTYFHEALKKREVQKTYHALVHGNWSNKIKQIDLPLKRHLLPHGERIVRVDKLDGKEALTSVRILQKFDDYTLVEAIPHTGRTHQIRVHLTAFDHPIVCDKKYGVEAKDQGLISKGFNRLFLHSARLSFKDPKTTEEIYFEAPYDRECSKLLDLL
ncbi:RluA family pseudouridine synthase [Caedibacter taeniospiralis]|uniref:RluA family pseudouridine synthase n=1 Tax=Caedibacter taeniospiralis TaxID=28907 RepID=UPI000C280F5E|nr:RluA family pseudouridine synthase [Caedibacter taeniospiralis]